MKKNQKAYYHLPGLFEFYDLYRIFFSIFREHREYFYDWCEVGSVYGAPCDCLWGGGRVGFGDHDPEEVLELMQEYRISARLTFSNSLIKEEHLTDKRCNELCRLFEGSGAASNFNVCQNGRTVSACGGHQNGRAVSACGGHQNGSVRNGVIIYSDLLLDYIKRTYPGLYFVSSTTKVLTEFEQLKEELNQDDFLYVVPDFRLNKSFGELDALSETEKNKIEFLCNECCYPGCRDRKICYENVSRKALGEDCADHVCRAPGASEGYRFSKAMEGPLFIGLDDIQKIYLPKGFHNFKIEGRGLGSAVILEFLLYYMTKPEYHLRVREKIYLDSTLDLF